MENAYYSIAYSIDYERPEYLEIVLDTATISFEDSVKGITDYQREQKLIT